MTVHIASGPLINASGEYFRSTETRTPKASNAPRINSQPDYISIPQVPACQYEANPASEDSEETVQPQHEGKIPPSIGHNPDTFFDPVFQALADVRDDLPPDRQQAISALAHDEISQEIMAGILWTAW